MITSQLRKNLPYRIDLHIAFSDIPLEADVLCDILNNLFRHFDS